MKKIVSPVRWIDHNKVEHPPLMMHHFLQGVCGGLRWLQAKQMAQYITKKALASGYPGTRAQRAAYHLPAMRRSTHKHNKHITKKVKNRNAQQVSQQQQQISKSSSSSSLRPCLSSTNTRNIDNHKNRTNNALTLTSPSSSSSSLLLSSHSQQSLALLSQPRQRLVTYDVLDCTFGSGFHTGCILHNGSPYTRVIAMDCDYAVQPFARSIASQFGADRFRFFAQNMSQAKLLFGQSAFDAIVIDPGPSLTQLEDPSRGFEWQSDGDHALDMRYGIHKGQNALGYLNVISQHTLASSLARYELLTREQSIKLARAIIRNRPFHGAYDVMDAITEMGQELPHDGWNTQQSYRKVSMSWKFFTSLRGVINDEYSELRTAVQDAFVLLRDDGRLVVFTRLPWQQKMISSVISQHPHGLLCYKERVENDEIVQYGHSRHTQMWVATKTAQSAAVLKNAFQLTKEDVQHSSIRWMAGTYASQTRGFPAQNLTFTNLSSNERKIQHTNAHPPPIDPNNDDDDDNNSRWRFLY